MLRRSRFLNFPMVMGAVIIGVVSGKAIFGPPLEEYWRKKLEEEAGRETETNPLKPYEPTSGPDAKGCLSAILSLGSGNNHTYNDFLERRCSWKKGIFSHAGFIYWAWYHGLPNQQPEALCGNESENACIDDHKAHD
ncbi:unnamed protein product [Victoria cruziana]